MDDFCFFLVCSSQGAAGFNVMDDSSQPLVPVSSGSSCDLAVCSPHYLFDSELSGAPRPWVFGGCVFSYYTHPPYRTPSELAPLFNDVSVLLPQSLSSLLTSWLPRSLLFLWQRPPELNIAEVPSQRICWLPTKKRKRKRPSSHVIQLRTKSPQTQNLTSCISSGSWVLVETGSSSASGHCEKSKWVVITVLCLQLVYAHGKNKNIHPLLPLLNMCFCVSKNTHTLTSSLRDVANNFVMCLPTGGATSR